MAGFPFVKLNGSVGHEGVNAYSDVTNVQALLNASLPDCPHHLAVDGRCGPKTIAAIKLAERQFIRSSKPDGRLDPHGPTLHALNHTMRATPAAANLRSNAAKGSTLSATRQAPAHGRSLTPNLKASNKSRTFAGANTSTGARASTTQDASGSTTSRAASDSSGMVGAKSGEITPAAAQAAQATQRSWKVPASITLGQYIIESGAGHRMPKSSNNPFGIKAGKSQPSVMAWTYEFLKDGTRVHILAPFRVFKTLDEAFQAHGKLLAEHPAYANARKHYDDPDAFARCLEGHYSTTKGYGQTLIDQMRAHDLYRYNVK